MNLYIGVGQGDIHPQHVREMRRFDGSWVFIDRYVRRSGVVPMDGAHLAFRDGSLSTLYSSHVLEHFSHRDVLNVLQEWYRVLRSGGCLFLNVPDLDWACRAWLDPALRTEYFQTDEKMLEIFYGGQDVPGETHYVGFSTGLLAKVLDQVGFVRLDMQVGMDAHDMGVIIARAYKP